MLDQVKEACEVLSRPGAVIIVPTETVYGLVCDWADETARKRIYELKKRCENKPLAMFALNANMAEKSGAKINPQARKLLDAFAPGPITVITEGNAQYPTIGIRIPAHEFILQLLALRNRPLASTSANASGMPNVLTPDEALRQLAGRPDMIVDGGALPENAAASTVVSACNGQLKILRQGPISEKAIHELLYQ